MYILDSHIHFGDGDPVNGSYKEQQKKYLSELAAAGVSGSQIMSKDPRLAKELGCEGRLRELMEFCDGADNLYPFYWIDPMEDDFLEQIDKAYNAGVDGFKIICSGFYPGDENVLAACTKIAELGKPVLFHSGILWDGVDSSRYNRPGEYESLLEVPDLKFCLAHVSWPWTDECIAVYGKFNNAFSRRPELSCEMFIDITPGTPHVYREEVFKRLFCSDYQVKYNVMFGSDCNTDGYNVAWTKDWVATDVPLIRKFNPNDPDDVIEHVYSKNFLRFMGKIDEDIKREYPGVAE